MNSTTLYCTEDGSDKVYVVSINDAGNGLYTVDFQYGPRGGTLRPGTKTPKPVDLAAAQKAYEKVVNEKLRKGYTEDTSGKAFVATNYESRSTGILPQLLNPIEEEQLEKYFLDDAYMMQEKMDGERRLVLGTDKEVIGINRKGLSVQLPDSLQEFFDSVKARPFLLDGEVIGDMYCVFDLLQANNRDLREDGAEARFWSLMGFLHCIPRSGRVQPVCCAFNEPEKRRMFGSIKHNRGEGVVFKHREAPYRHGRPNSGGTQIKYKFTERATCLVHSQYKDKNSVELMVHDDVRRPDQAGRYNVNCKLPVRFVGKVTIPANFEIPKPGTLVEVRYLYVASKGSLFQSVYLGPRPDKDVPDTYSSLKQKPTNEEEDEA